MKLPLSSSGVLSFIWARCPMLWGIFESSWLFCFCFFLLQCLAVLALAAFFLSSVVPGAVSDQRNQDCGSAFAPEGSLPIESQSRFLFFHELNGF